MKKALIAAALILLTACSPSSSFVQGEVVSCESISQDPNFTGGITMDCLDRTEGAQLGGLRGPMVVNVWGSWCGPCKKEIPVLRAFHERAKDKVQLIGVDVEEANFDDGRTFVKRNGITWPNLFDPDGRSREYFGMGVPVTWFIAADGSVAYKHIGIINDLDEILTLTEKHLGVRL
jgi:cytochrome c biogenesis protein CcmG, thiol:disulfide interchange protein DsbE